MKKDTLYLFGGLAFGAVLFYLFKDVLIGEKKKKNSTNGYVPDGGGLGAPDFYENTQPNTSEFPNSQTNMQTTPTALPYALNPIDPNLAATQVHQDIFGGCDFPIVSDSSSVCVKRLQDAFDVDQTGLFDMATQEAYDSFIEGMPNRSEGHFSGYGRQGCITSDPQSGEQNLCGLNHDQYLEILFKMGIPLTQTYDE